MGTFGHIGIYLQTCLKYFDPCFQTRNSSSEGVNGFLKDNLLPNMVLKRKKELWWAGAC